MQKLYFFNAPVKYSSQKSEAFKSESLWLLPEILKPVSAWKQLIKIQCAPEECFVFWKAEELNKLKTQCGHDS